MDANGLPWEEVKELAVDIMKDAAEHWGYEQTQKEHANEKLEKFWYKHFEGKKRSSYSDHSERLSHNASIPKSRSKTLKIDQQGANVPIKVENQAFINMTAEMKVVKAGKTRLGAVLDKSADFSAAFEEKKDDDPESYRAVQKLHEQFVDSVAVATTFVDGIRILRCDKLCLQYLVSYFAMLVDVVAHTTPAICIMFVDAVFLLCVHLQRKKLLIYDKLSVASSTEDCEAAHEWLVAKARDCHAHIAGLQSANASAKEYI